MTAIGRFLIGRPTTCHCKKVRDLLMKISSLYHRQSLCWQSPRLQSLHWIGALAFLTLVPQHALAQQNPNVNVINELKETGREMREMTPTRSKTDVENEDAEQDPSIPPNAELIRFQLQSITVDGNTVIAPEDLEKLYASNLNQEVTLKWVYDLAAEMTRLYRAEGYALSRVIVPPQTIQGGSIKLQAVEGFVDQIQFDGETRGSRRYLLSIAENILESKPLHQSVLERYLLLIGDLAGASVRGVLSPSSSTAGASTLTLVMDHDLIDAKVSFDNRGSKFVGRPRLFVEAGTNSLFTFYEQITLQAMTVPGDADELKMGQGIFTLPLGTEGTQFSIVFNQAASEPGFTLEDLDIDTDTIDLMLNASYPLIRSRDQNLRLGLGMDFYRSKTDSFGELLNKDVIRSVDIYASYDVADGWEGINYFNVTFSQGLPIFDASKKGDPFLTRVGGDPDFSKFNISYARYQSLAVILDNLGFTGSATTQLTPDVLLASEEYGLGTLTYGRGYDPSELTGDQAIAAKAELIYNIPLSYEPLFAFPQVYAFYDYGYVKNNDDDLVDDDSTLASIGGGLRMDIYKNIFYLNAELAHQLMHVDEGGDNEDHETRGYIQIEAKF